MGSDGSAARSIENKSTVMLVGTVIDEKHVQPLPPNERPYWEGTLKLDRDNECIVIVEDRKNCPPLDDGLIRKNIQVIVAGKLQTHKWTTGEGKQRSRTVVKAHRMELVGPLTRTRYVEDTV